MQLALTSNCACNSGRRCDTCKYIGERHARVSVLEPASAYVHSRVVQALL